MPACVVAHARKKPEKSRKILLDLRLKDARSLRDPGSAALAASFQTLIAHTLDLVYVKDRNHVLLAASKPLVDLSESAQSVADLVGKTDYDLFPEALADISYRNETKAWAEARRVNERVLAIDKAGQRIWIDDRKYPLNDAEGKPAGLLGIAPDITVHIEREHQLRESEQALREAQKIAGLGSFELDLRTHTWKTSPELDRIVGTPPDYNRKFEGLWPLIHPEDRAELGKRLERILRGETDEYRREYRIVRQCDGAVRYVHTRGRIEFDAGGKRALLRGTLQDITERKQAELALRESKDLLRLFIENAPVALAMLDREMRYVAVSGRWLEDYGLAGQDVIGRSHYELVPDLPERWKQAHRRGLAGEMLSGDEDRFDRADGTVQWRRWRLSPWRTGDGAIGGIVLFVEDISAQKQAEDRLRLAASVFTHAAEGITITDAEGIILEVNEAFTRITGYSREEVLGKNPRILQSGLQTAEFYQNMWQSLLTTGHWSGEIWNKTKGGEIFAEKLTINAVPGPAGQAPWYVAQFFDVTQAKDHERQLEYVAHYDALTGLPNRALLTDRLRQAMAQTRRREQYVAVAYFDLDGFKTINERYGQEAGDSLLAAIAKRLTGLLREGDSLARLSGDEFAAVLLDLPNPEAVYPALERLLHAVSQPVRLGSRFLSITASVGAAVYPAPDDPDADQLLRQASQAMYQAKLAGGSRYEIFNPSQDRNVQERRHELERIERALQNREFVLYYQPKVNMRTGQVVGAEALVRWRHPERGLLLPGQFLPALQNHPLTIELGEWVIDTALQQIETWKHIGLDLPVSVNIDALQLQQMGFPERLRQLLAVHPRVAPDHFELEVLETSALQDLAQTSSVLEACRSLGVEISIDDFGTGYASLTYLKRLPVQTLKIDQSFVRDILEDPEDLSILEAVLGLATAFRRKMVAEGVETVEHGLMLLQLGCELAQGYGIARPMPAEDLPVWLQSWRPNLSWFDAPPVHAGNRLLRYATVEHSAWLGAFEAYLQGKRHTPPPLDPQGCRFAAWMDAERQAGRASLPAFHAIDILHQQLHRMAAEILSSQQTVPNSEGLARLSILHRMRDEFLDSLMSLN